MMPTLLTHVDATSTITFLSYIIKDNTVKKRKEKKSQLEEQLSKYYSIDYNIQKVHCCKSYDVIMDQSF